MAEDTSGYKYVISGKVQGVGFRWFVKKNADLLRLNGYVKNLPDGKVEAVAIGTESQIEEFWKIISKGPAFSRVADIQQSQLNPSERAFSSFEITY